MKYGVQWIDYGGELDLPLNTCDLERALSRLSIPLDSVSSLGGVQIQEKHFWYIDTKTELPQWNKGRNPYDLNFSKNMERFDEELKLWFYTFELDESTADKWYSETEYDELNGW